MPIGRVCKNVTGDFNQVVMDFTAEYMGEIERRMQETVAGPMYRERLAGYMELWIAGSREILRVACPPMLSQ